MSKLKDRLDRRRGRVDEGTPETNGTRSEMVEQLRRRMERVAARYAPRAPRDLWKEDDTPLPGETVETDHGPVQVNTVSYPPDHAHGAQPLRAFLSSGPGLAVLARVEKLASLPPSSALFLDTETTGLAGGTGTLPFLVGLGYFDDDGGFVLEQFFCREPSQEPAQLSLLSRRLARAGYLVTFNGRSYDVPLLNTRFVMNRMKNPGHALPHLDLLHVARRIFGRRLDDRSLTALERSVLGFEREGDIPGSAIPAAYSAYLRGGSSGDMAAVMEHNAHDIVALAALGGMLECMYGDPQAVEHAADSLGLARAAFEAGETDAADRHLTTVARSDSPDDRRVGLYMAARHAARRKDFDRARDLWLEAVSIDPGDGWAHLSLAKHFEHREKNLDLALDHARRSFPAEGDEACAYRIARIERKRSRLSDREDT